MKSKSDSFILEEKDQEMEIDSDMFKDTLDKVVEFDNESSANYKVVHDSKAYKLWYKSIDNVYLVKGVMTVKGLSSKECFKMLVDFDVRVHWDHIMGDFAVLKKTNEHEDHIYMTIPAPWPVTDRDFVQKRTRATNYKGYDHVIHFVSDDIPEMP